VSRPLLSLGIPTFGSPVLGDWRRLLDLARAADDEGIDRLVVPDHVVNGPDVADYPWGRFPTGPDADWLEPLTVLTALAAVTERVRLATGILVAPLRPAVVLAKTVATLDVLSGGRVDLGVGVGWQRAEFEAAGLDFAARGRLLTDVVGACRALWRDRPATFTSTTVSFQDVSCAPGPCQDPLPVWFSGVLHDRNVGRVARLGDGWIPIMGAGPDDVAAGGARLREALAAEGRDPASLRVRGTLAVVRDGDGRPDLAATMAGAAALVAAGATDVHANLRVFDPELADPAGTMRRLVAAFEESTPR
jgi:probable F420-dependent oxidoreductase